MSRLVTPSEVYKGFRYVWSSTQTSDGTDPSPTATAPSEGSGIIHTGGAAGLTVLALGTDAANETFTFNIFGWKKTSDDLWVPAKLADLTATLGTTVGVSGYIAADTVFFADTLVKNDGAGTVTVYSPADNNIAVAMIGYHWGFEYLQFVGTKGTAAGYNLLIAPATNPQ